jgi:hypothetical protein
LASVSRCSIRLAARNALQPQPGAHQHDGAIAGLVFGMAVAAFPLTATPASERRMTSRRCWRCQCWRRFLFC